jgi:Zn-dependent alcohol dehydrogenase
VLQSAQELTRRGGVIVITSAAPSSQRDLEFDVLGFVMSGKRIQSAPYGYSRSRLDIPMLVEMYLRGDFMLDELVTTRYPLEQINQAFTDMKAGRNVRGVIVYDEEDLS